MPDNVSVNLPFKDFKEFEQKILDRIDVTDSTFPEIAKRIRTASTDISLPHVLWGDYRRAANLAHLSIDEFMSILVFFGGMYLVKEGLLQDDRLKPDETS